MKGAVEAPRSDHPDCDDANDQQKDAAAHACIEPTPPPNETKQQQNTERNREYNTAN